MNHHIDDFEMTLHDIREEFAACRAQDEADATTEAEAPEIQWDKLNPATMTEAEREALTCCCRLLQSEDPGAAAFLLKLEACK